MIICVGLSGLLLLETIVSDAVIALLLSLCCSIGEGIVILYKR